jgi:hypothetical protein
LIAVQAFVLDDEAGGIVLSGNINIVSHVISAGYSPLCMPSSFFATNGNLTISTGANIQVCHAISPRPQLTIDNADILFEIFSLATRRATQAPSFVPRSHLSTTITQPPRLSVFIMFNTCLQNVLVLGNLDASHASFNGQVIRFRFS